MGKNKIYIFTSGSKYAQMILEELNEDSDINVIFDSGKEKNKYINWLKSKSLSKDLSKLFPSVIMKYLYHSFFKNLNIEKKTKATVIFFDSYDYSKREKFIEWLRHEYPNVTLILWLWNSIKNNSKIEKYKNIYQHVYTFDKNDAIKYDILYQPQFYSEKLAEKYKNPKVEEKVVFIGFDKGRIEYINNIGKQLENLEINTLFHVCKDKKNEYNKEKLEKMWIDKYIMDKTLDYSKVLTMTSSGDTILDVVSENQSGLTLRAMESLFLKKKLITNNQSLREYDFYNPKNILIIENQNDITKEFFSEKYTDIDQKILKKYNVTKWIERILKGESEQ